jgi:hypothetical protein
MATNGDLRPDIPAAADGSIRISFASVRANLILGDKPTPGLGDVSRQKCPVPDWHGETPRSYKLGRGRVKTLLQWARRGLR